MKINKRTMFACGIISILTFILIIIIGLKYDTDNQKISLVLNICLGLFTGSTVSMVIAIIGYFNEKEILIEKAKNNLKTLYVNMYVMCIKLQDISSKIFTCQDLKSLSFDVIAGLSEINVECLEKMDIGLFNPIFKNGKLGKAYNIFSGSWSIIYTIKNNSKTLENNVLKYTIKLNELTLAQNQAQSSFLNIQNDLANDKNNINIKTAHLHEYMLIQTTSLELVIKEFFNYIEGKNAWENNIKPNLIEQINSNIG